MAVPGRVLRSILDLDAALAAHLEIIEATKVMFAQTMEMTVAELCADYALLEKWGEVHTYARQATENRLNILYLYMGLTPWYEIEALVRAGEIERAVGDVERFEAHFGKSRRHRIPYLRSLTVLAQHRGQIDMAIDHLREAANVAEGIGLPGERWLIWKTLGDLYLKQTEQEQAHHTYGEAARLVSQLAATLRAEKRRKKYLSSPLVEQGLRASSF